MIRGRVAVCGAVLSSALAVAVSSGLAVPASAAGHAFGSGPVVAARASEPVVITGAQVPQWSHLAPTGVAATYPSGAATTGDSVRSAHNGILTVPPDSRTGVDPDMIAAYRWDGAAWTEIPVQVDQRYPYFLANGHSSFSTYSGTDEELTYAWNPTAHSIGEESWKKVFGGITGITDPSYTDPNPCRARYQLPGAQGQIEYAQAVKNGVITPPTAPGVAADDYTRAMPSPVRTPDGKQELTDDDEIAMMAGDAGVAAPTGTPPPASTVAGSGQTVTIVDPTAATDGSAQQSYIYLFLQPGGSSFKVTADSNGVVSTNGYVDMQRDNGADTVADSTPNADEWVDRATWAPGDTEKIGTSNTSYGPNIGGDVCRTSPGNDQGISTADGTPRPSKDRQPRDGMTITTPTYRLYASGRWMVRQYSITAPGTTSSYGPNLISRWKGRAFQSSPDSSVSLVGFEDEQVNWEMNSTLLGWKVGPVRAIREVWGADSGTNVTKTEIYYRDADIYHYHVRVHPIPPDGLYTSWDYRLGDVTTYYNMKQQGGVPIDGTNSHSVGEVDTLPVANEPAYFNTCDPTYDICSAIDNPEEIAGPNGGMVYVAELSGPSSAVSPAVVPYYRDDACFDDGTGDAPVPRPFPGDASTSQSVEQGYVNYWAARGMPTTGTLSTDYAQLKCQPSKVGDPNTPAWQQTPFQGAIGEMGLHFFVTGDTDNAWTPKTVDEIDAQQWRFAIPMSSPSNQLLAYGQDVQAKLIAAVTPYGVDTALQPVAVVPEAPLLPSLVVAGLGGAVGAGAWRRRRRGPVERSA